LADFGAVRATICPVRAASAVMTVMNVQQAAFQPSGKGISGQTM